MSTSGQIARDRRPLVLVVVVIAVALLVAGWYFSLGPGTRILSPEGSTIASFSGSGDQATASFTARAGWKIDWSTSGGGFSLEIVADRSFGTVIDEEEPGEGLSTVTSGGTFHLEISAGGPWTVTIIQGE